MSGDCYVLNFLRLSVDEAYKNRGGLATLCNKYGLLTKCEVKMTGYWPSSFFACLWTETKSRSINSQKKNEANIQSLDRTNLVNKGFII